MKQNENSQIWSSLFQVWFGNQTMTIILMVNSYICYLPFTILLFYHLSILLKRKRTPSWFTPSCKSFTHCYQSLGTKTSYQWSKERFECARQTTPTKPVPKLLRTNDLGKTKLYEKILNLDSTWEMELWIWWIKSKLMTLITSKRTYWWARLWEIISLLLFPFLFWNLEWIPFSRRNYSE